MGIVKLRLLNENHKRKAGIRRVQPTRCEVSPFIYFCKTFYMFQTVFPPSSGAQNCTYSVRYVSVQHLTLYVQFWAPDDGGKNRLKRVECLTEINWETSHLVGCTLRIYEGDSKSKDRIHLTAIIKVSMSNFTYHFST